MKIRLKMRIFLFLFIIEIFSSKAQEEGKKIKIVVVTEKGFTIPTAAITDSHYVGYGELETEEIELEENNDEEEVCNEIFVGKDPPTIMIDNTRRPRGMDNRLSPVVKRVARKMGLPTVSSTYGNNVPLTGWEDLEDNEKEYLVHISPPGDIIPLAVRDICELQKFKSAGILYDKELVMDLKYSTLLENIPTKHIIRLVENNENDIRKKIQDMKPPDIANFFVIGSNSIIEKTLKTANSLKLYGKQFSWYLITTENEVPSCSCANMSAVLLTPTARDNSRLEWIMRKLEKFPSEMEATFYFDLGEFVTKTVRDMIDKGNWPEQITYPECSDMTLTEEMQEQRSRIRLMTNLKQISFDGTFGKFMFTNKGNFEEIQLKLTKLKYYNGHRVEKRASGKDGTIGTWTAGKGKGSLQFEKGEDLKEYAAVTMYRVTTLVQPPFIYKVNNSGSIEYVGYCIDLLDEIKKILKFEYTLFETADGKFGAMNEKGEWNGMIKDLKDRKAEIALGPISVMAERETVVDFTVPYYDLVGITILMKKTKVASSLFKFLTVLENKVWGCILAAYFFTSFLMYLFDRLSPYSFHNNREKYKDDDENRDFTAKECLWFCMTSLTPQGGGEAPRNLSGRLVAATWWLFGFIIIASYTANLAAFLTVSRLDSPIEGLDDLAKQYKIKYAPQNDTSSMTYFERRAYIEDLFYEIWKNMSLDDSLNDTQRAKLAVWDYPVSDKYTKIWWTMKESKMPSTFEEGVERVKSSNSTYAFAFIADSTQIKYALMTNCDLISVGSEFSRKPLALAVQQGSTLKDEMSSAILQLLNQRVLEGLKEKWWNKNPDKVVCDDSEKDSDGISIANIGGVFIVIFIGIVLSCITLIFEYWYYKQKRSGTRVVAVKDYNNDPTRNVKH